MLQLKTAIAAGVMLLNFIGFVAAQTEDIVILSSVLLQRNGDRDPIFQSLLDWNDPGLLQLTSLGANQSYSAGQLFRALYLPRAETGILGISGMDPDNINLNHISILAADTQYISASAQAFLQGLYPTTDITDGFYFPDIYVTQSNLQLNFPNGYQYPWIRTAGPTDSESIWLSGNVGCATWNTAAEQSMQSTDSNDLDMESKELYDMFASYFASDEQVPEDQFSFANAPAVFDYVRFLRYHDMSAYNLIDIDQTISPEDMTLLRSYSDRYNWMLYDNVDPSLYSGAMAGQTYAGKVLQQLTTNVNNKGLTAKLNLYFSESPPMTSFFAISGLKNHFPEFYGEPEFGSSMVFELFAPLDKTVDDNGEFAYPSVEDLYVRFRFRNGTIGQLHQYPIFIDENPLDSGASYIPYLTFYERMSVFAVGDVDAWCSMCQSWGKTQFCNPLYIGIPDDSSGDSIGPYTITPKMAGVIGAVSVLALLVVILVVGVGCFGLRFKRQSQNKFNGTEAGTAAGAGGFKGAMKLGSDLDVSGAGKSGEGVSVIAASREEEYIGKERIGSWELKNSPSKPKEDSRPVSPVSESNYDMGRRRDERDPDEMSAIENPFVIRAASPSSPI